MAIAGLVIPIIGPILDKLIPDVNQREAAKEAMTQALETNDVSLLLEQLKINAIEAASPSIFVSGWRPALGWVCVLSVASLVFFYGAFPVIASIFHLAAVPEPSGLVVDFVLYLTTGLCGMRMWEGFKGVKQTNIKK